MRQSWLLALLCLLTIGCRQQEQMPEENAVYYWRTELGLDSVERAFLQQYDIRKVYCRYFDVVMTDGKPMPNATMQFEGDTPSDVELIPVVYITEDCMRQPHEGLAQKLVSRIVQMNETNDVKNVREIQIDCDYTSKSRQTYYDFLAEVRKEAKSRGMQISTTIRLHQLSMKAPPVDYGVLMIYNTGDPRRFTERNPILDYRDVEPYLRYLSDYPLPLAAAYPVFLWQRTVHGVHVEHTVTADEILRVKESVEQRRPELRHTILTYHLDNENIKRYKPETYEAIYHH